MPQSTIPLAILDFAPVVKGATPADAFRTRWIFDHQAWLRSFELVAEARKATTQAG